MPIGCIMHNNEQLKVVFIILHTQTRNIYRRSYASYFACTHPTKEHLAFLPSCSSPNFTKHQLLTSNLIITKNYIVTENNYAGVCGRRSNAIRLIHTLPRQPKHDHIKLCPTHTLCDQTSVFFWSDFSTRK